MMNYIGKTLVFINLALSGLFVAFALAVYTNRIDWGWVEPRAEYGVRIPSELDKRIVAYKDAAATKNRKEIELQQAVRKLNAAQFSWHNYQLWANDELEDLFGGTKEREIKQVKFDKGRLVLDPNRMGRPLLQDPVIVTYNDGTKDHQIKVNKSLKAYLQDLSAIQQKLIAVNEKLAEWVDKQTKLTIKLSGEVDPVTKQQKSRGLYDLFEEEVQRKKLLQQEIEELRPNWVRKLVDAQLLLQRRQQLEARLKELKVQLAAQGQ